jgi:hypothetical protein
MKRDRGVLDHIDDALKYLAMLNLDMPAGAVARDEKLVWRHRQHLKSNAMMAINEARRMIEREGHETKP